MRIEADGDTVTITMGASPASETVTLDADPVADPISKRWDCEVAKVSDELGVVFGFAMVSKVDGEPYVDLQGHELTDEEILRGSLDFMSAMNRQARDMHADGDDSGDVPFGFPLTEDIAKALEIETRKTGFVIGMRPDAEMLAKFKSGEYRGFSIGGVGVEVDVEEDDE